MVGVETAWDKMAGEYEDYNTTSKDYDTGT